MTRLARLLACTIAVLVATGCFRVAVTDGALPSGERHAPWNHVFLFGLAGEPELDVRRYCSTSAARVETGETLATLGVTVLTLGVYTPRQSTITCAAQAAPGAAGAPEGAR